MSSKPQAKITSFFGVKRSLTTSVLPQGDAGSSGFLPPAPKRIKIIEDDDDDDMTHGKPAPVATNPKLSKQFFCGVSSARKLYLDRCLTPNFSANSATASPAAHTGLPPTPVISSKVDNDIEKQEHGGLEPTEVLPQPVGKSTAVSVESISSGSSFGSRASSSTPRRAHTLMVIEDTGSLEEIEDYDSDNSEEMKIREFVVKNTTTEYEKKQKEEIKRYNEQMEEEFAAEEAQAWRTHAEAKKKVLPAPYEREGGDNSGSKLIREKIITERGHRLQVRHGDLTREVVGAIVNAANSALAHGGGVAGAISRAAGPAVQKESTDWIRRHGELPTGGCAITGPGRLRCEKIIHAVGPVYTDGEHHEAELLHEAVLHSLLMAEAEQLSSISLPAISSGIFGFPKDECATLMFDAAIQFYQQRPTTVVKEIRFCNFDGPTVKVFASEFDKRFPED